jgi:2'-5' RNA ligase
MPRLFTGIEIPLAVADGLAMMAGGLAGARWISAEAYHITLRFIGDIDDATAGDVTAALEETAGENFSLSLAGTGCFGGKKPRSIWAGLEPCPALNELQARQERACQMAGLRPDGRKFTPHVTLARLSSGVSVLDVEHYLAAHAGYRSASFEAGQFVLYSAKPSTGGGPYVVQQAYPLRENIQ